MKKRRVYVTANDLRRLSDLLAEARAVNYRDRKDLRALEAELDRAKVVESSKVPATVVTMNTRLRYVDLEDGAATEATLVFPPDADIDEGRMSVMSPIGTALLGYSEGDTIEWEVPAGKRTIRIEKILYQPESAGDLHL